MTTWKGPGYHLDVHTDLTPDQKAEVLIDALPWLEEFAGQRIVGQIRRQRHGRRTPEAVLRRGHGLPAPGGPAPGCGARGRPADLADARRAGHRIGVPRRTARHHARSYGRGAHGTHRQGLARAGRPDQRARPVRRRPVRRGRRPVLRHAAQAGHRRPGHRHRPGGRCGERGRVGRRGPDQRRTHPRGLLGRAERGRRHAGAQRQRRFGRRRPGRGARARASW